MLENIERKMHTLGIFLDFSKAYFVLFDKLFQYGIWGIPLSLITSYLKNRCQFVLINNTRPFIKNIHSGVPQGSILGSLLFLLYANDIVNIGREIQYVIYADDTTMVLCDTNQYRLINKENNMLNKLSLVSSELH